MVAYCQRSRSIDCADSTLEKSNEMTKLLVSWLFVFNYQVHTIGRGSADISFQARLYPLLSGSMIKLIPVKSAKAVAFLISLFEVGASSFRTRLKAVRNATDFTTKNPHRLWLQSRTYPLLDYRLTAQSMQYRISRDNF